MEVKKRRWFAPRADRPDAVAEDTTPNFRFFFKLLWRKAGKLTSLNLLMLFQIAPLVAVVLIYLLGPSTNMAESPLFAPLYGVYTVGRAPSVSPLIGLFSRQLQAPILSPARIAVIAFLLAFLVLTWGWQNVGAIYNLRSLVRGDSCFLFSDYFYAIRKNLKQGFLYGLLDALILFLLGFDVYYFNTAQTTSFLGGVTYILVLVLIVLYFIMRVYIYLMLITFDLSVFKMFKNALIFLALGVKRNAAALGGVILLIALHALIIVPSVSVGFVIPLVLPLFYLLPLLGFLLVYAVYPIIKRYMIDPVTAPPATETTD